MGGFRAGATEGVMTRRRRALVTLAILVLLGAVCGALGWLATRDDPPPEDADLRVHREVIPDEENAFTCFEEADKAVTWPEGADTRYAVAEILDGGAWDAALVEKTLEENRRALGLWEQGLARARFQTPAATSINTPTPYAGQWLTLAKVASLRSLSLAKTSRPEEAFEEAMKVVQFGHRIEGAKGCLVVWLMGAMVKQLGLDRLRQPAAEAPLPPERLRACVYRLAPFGPDTAGLADAYRVEYAVFCNTVDGLSAGTVSWFGDVVVFFPVQAQPPPGNVMDLAMRSPYHLKPNRIKALSAPYYRALIEQVSKTNAEAKPRLQRLDDDLDKGVAGLWLPVCVVAPNGLGDIVLKALIPIHSSVNKLKCDENVAVAATRLVLAIRAFEATSGRLPDALDDLVPAFIDAVPADDFDGKPMRWSKEKRIVYSVGPDLVDDGGREATTAWESATTRGQSRDLVYHLDPRDAPRLDEDEAPAVDGPQEAPAEAP